MSRKTEGKAGGRPSILLLLTAGQLVLFLFLLIFVQGSLSAIRRQEDERAAREQQESADREWIRFEEESAGYEHTTLELLSEATDSPNLLSEDKGKQSLAKKELYDKLKDRNKYNRYITYSFCGKRDVFFVAYGSYTQMNTLEARNWITRQEEADFSDNPAGQWLILSFDGQDYFVYYLIDNGLYAGCMIDAAQIERQLAAIAGSDGAFRIIDRRGNTAGSTSAGWEDRDNYFRTEMAGGLTAELVIGDQYRYPRRYPSMLTILGLICLAAFALQSVIVYRAAVKPVRRLSEQLSVYGEDMEALHGSAAPGQETAAEAAGAAGPAGPGENADRTAPTGSGETAGGRAPAGSGETAGRRTSTGSGGPAGGRAPAGSGETTAGAGPAASGTFGRESAAAGLGRKPVEIEVNARTKELYTLQSSARHLLDEVVLSRMKDYEYQLKEQETELLLVRSQLRPHFYLNALTTIDAMTYQNRDEDIRRFLQALSVHVRYMLRTDESRITLGEELRHIEAYLDMQSIRYPDRIFYALSVPDALKAMVIPHLLIYTIVENSFKYALGVEDTLFLMIEAKETEGGFAVIVEDNGRGYSGEVLAMINAGKLPEMSKEESRHIGLRNVRRTMELKYGSRGRLRLENIVDTDGSEIRGARAILEFPADERVM